jgi:single-strand DNA-binding protein
MYDVNSITISGRATRDAELSALKDGTQLVKFAVACQSGGKDTPTSFFNVTVWKLAWVAEAVKKGVPVCLSGRIEQRKWQAKDGTEKTSFDITASSVKVYSDKPKAEKVSPNADREKVFLSDAVDFDAESITEEGNPF